MRTDKPVPDDWTPVCNSCTWFLEQYDREDCYLWEGLAWNGGEGYWHILNNYGAKNKEDKAKLALEL